MILGGKIKGDIAGAYVEKLGQLFHRGVGVTLFHKELCTHPYDLKTGIGSFFIDMRHSTHSFVVCVLLVRILFLFNLLYMLAIGLSRGFGKILKSEEKSGRQTGKGCTAPTRR